MCKVVRVEGFVLLKARVEGFVLLSLFLSFSLLNIYISYLLRSPSAQQLDMVHYSKELQSTDNTSEKKNILLKSASLSCPLYCNSFRPFIKKIAHSKMKSSITVVLESVFLPFFIISS